MSLLQPMHSSDLTSFHNSEKYAWNVSELNNETLYSKGDASFYLELSEILKTTNDSEQWVEQLVQVLSAEKRMFSGVYETSDYLIAWVDHIRSWPLFYAVEGNQLYISNDGYFVKDAQANSSINNSSLIEYKMAGYVVGENTVYNEIKCLLPGECIIWNKKTSHLTRKQYYSYNPTFSNNDEQDLLDELGHVIDGSIKRIINKANGRPIWIPLSGGLDSRIILCKLHEFGYTNIQTFTYGPKFNFEAKAAKKVADALNIPWRFVSVDRQTTKKYFSDEKRADFWRFANDLKSIPCMREYAAIRSMQEHNLIPNDALFINGQSGDYITGGHIPPTLVDASNRKELYDIIIDKHYDQFKNLKTDQNRAICEASIDQLISAFSAAPESGDKPLYYDHEVWEFAGRQICYVAHGVKIYEYFGYEWEMPLWDRELCDFYESVSLEQKLDQKLYKTYLQNYNYKNLFPKTEPYIWRWPIPMLWVVPCARVIGLIFGQKKKDTFYSLMKYYGHYANQYAFFSFKEHKQTHGNARNVISLYLLKWLEEKNLKL